jgi:hypothetical protein
MYNALQYSFKVWLTSAVVVPSIYLLYYLMNGAAYFPAREYVELLGECLLFSLPVWFVFILLLDRICRTSWPVITKKWTAFFVLQLLLILLFTAVIQGFGNIFISWGSCFDLLIICSYTVAVCIFLYPLKPAG